MLRWLTAVAVLLMSIAMATPSQAQKPAASGCSSGQKNCDTYFFRARFWEWSSF